MKTAATEAENWRKKYFDSLSSLEDEHRQFSAMEATLKRLVGRLCTASLGQSAGLDEQVKKLQAAVRREARHDELERITPALTEAIQALDRPEPVAAQPAPAASTNAAPAIASLATTVATTSAVDPRVGAVLTALLTELRRDSTLVSDANAIDAKLSGSLKPDELPAILASLVDLVGQRIQRIEHARQEIESLLNQMMGKLDEIGRSVADQNRTHTQSQASSETLRVQLTGEMRAMGESVDATDDLQLLRGLVRNRLDSIDRHLQDFRQREAALTTEMLARNAQMRSRIEELESEARQLHGRLQDEQRFAAIDTLTQIPNRLAYDKRVEEELDRWQRFGHPACIAVLDVDHFKRVNDSYGHRAGDRVLRAVAECLSGRIRRTDFVARYGGEEFVMILSGTKRDDAVRVVDEMRTAVNQIGFHFRGAPVSITISCGITVFLADDSTGAAFDRADKALYQAKEAGRNRCIAG